jgi:uncharacterized protein involved in exopolysaccharide biosynthesis
MANNESVLTLRDILKVLFKRKSLIITVTVAATITATVVVFLKPPAYESVAQILVRRSIPEMEEPSANPAERGSQTFFRQINQADEMNTAISVLKSRDLVESVMDQMKLTPEQFDKVPDFRRYIRMAWNGCRDTGSYIWHETKYLLHLSRRPTAEEIASLKQEQFVNKALKAVIVEQIPDSDVLRIGIRMNDPALAQKFSHLYSEMALAWHFEKFRQTGNLSFFQDQADQSSDELAKLEKDLATMRHDMNLIGIAERRALIIESRFQFEARLNTVLANLAANHAEMRRIDMLLTNEPATATLTRETSINPLHQQVVDKIGELELRRVSDAGKLTPQSRTLRDMDDTLDGWKSHLTQIPEQQEISVVEGLNSVHQRLRQKQVDLAAETAALSAEAEVLRQRIAAYDSDLNNLNDGAYKVSDLERRIAAREAVYAQYLRNSEQARVSEAKQQARMANLNIVQSAALPVRPINPRKLFSILLSAGGSLLVSLAWAFAREMNDTSFENEQQIRNALALEPWATLPHIDMTAFRDNPLAIPASLQDPAQRLWTRLAKSCQKSPVTAAFVSSRRGEGTTTIALQAAMAAQAENHRVLLVDAGPGGKLSRILGLEDCQGLTDIEEQGSLVQCIHPTKHAGLFILPSGRLTTKPENIDWQTLLQGVKKAYDVVLFDIGHVHGNHPQPGMLAALDGVILIVAAHATRREIVQQTISELRGNREAHLLGMALNRRRFFIPEFLYRIA